MPVDVMEGELALDATLDERPLRDRVWWCEASVY
jgi:hypothetical protein